VSLAAGQHSKVRCLFVLALLFVSAVVAGRADAEDPVEAVVFEPRYILTEQNFDQRLFRTNVLADGNGNVVVRAARSANDLRHQMETVLENELNDIANDCFLTEGQKKKVMLAGRGDIVRFFERVDELRRKSTNKELSQQQYSQVMLDLQSLSYVPQFMSANESSLFRKALRKTMTAEQLERYRTMERSRQIKAIEMALANFDRVSNRSKLSEANRQKFIETMLTHGRIPKTPNPLASPMVLLEAVRLEQQIRPLFTDYQWERFQTQTALSKNLEPIMRRAGIWPMPASDPIEGLANDQ
jgi:hypothetical protein